jgi:hypothetical protein
MRTLVAAALLLAAAPLAAQDADRAVPGGGTLPDGWHVRLDRPDASAADVRFVPMGDGFHVTLGPAVVLWNPANTATGEYRARATFAQTRAPRHPEAYGLVLAGQNLDGQPPQGPDYLYFLVRGDGKYMVRHRAANGDLHTLAPWTEHPAVAVQDAEGQATNAVVAEAGAFGVRFLVNGQKVAEYLKADAPHLATDGVVGLRVNHNLDVHVSNFAVEKM